MNPMRTTASLVAACALLFFSGCSTARPQTLPPLVPEGKAGFVYFAAPTSVGRQRPPIECFTYQPPNWSGERIIVVHHGVLRNASEYRDHAVVLGDRFSALIVAPRFPEDEFPSRRYQRGGIVDADGKAAAPEDWTYAYIPEIVSFVRERMHRPHAKYWIIGHSAGGQFAMRMSAFQDTGAERIVAANPGTDLFPTRDLPFGWGFGSLPESLSNDEQLRKYLAAPLTLYLGTADDHPDEDLDMSENSLKQGPGRLQRGRAAFALGEKTAADHRWLFHWRLVEAKGVPHDHALMFADSSCEDALFGH